FEAEVELDPLAQSRFVFDAQNLCHDVIPSFSGLRLIRTIHPWSFEFRTVRVRGRDGRRGAIRWKCVVERAAGRSIHGRARTRLRSVRRVMRRSAARA